MVVSLVADRFEFKFIEVVEIAQKSVFEKR